MYPSKAYKVFEEVTGFDWHEGTLLGDLDIKSDKRPDPIERVNRVNSLVPSISNCQPSAVCQENLKLQITFANMLVSHSV